MSEITLRPGLVPIMQAAIDRMRREHKNFDLFDREDVASLVAAAAERDSLRDQRDQLNLQLHREHELNALNAEKWEAAEARVEALETERDEAEGRGETAMVQRDLAMARVEALERSLETAERAAVQWMERAEALSEALREIAGVHPDREDDPLYTVGVARAALAAALPEQGEA